MTTTSAKDYASLLEKEMTLPSGAVFKLKRRLDFTDYIDLLNFFSKEIGEPISSDIFTKIQRNPELITKMIQFTVPRMCLDPKVSMLDEDGSIKLSKMSLDDLVFINNLSTKLEVSE